MSSSRLPGASRRFDPISPSEIEREILSRLRLDDGDDFSLIQPPSVVSSLEQLSARSAPAGGEFVTSRPPVRASLPGSLGGVVTGELDTPRGSSSLQPAIFISEDTAATLCLGIIGSSGRFCVATKSRGLSHCGTMAHAKNKHTPPADCYWPPAGVLLGKAAAKQSPSIPKADVPRNMLPVFEKGLCSMKQWEDLIAEALRRGPPPPSRTTPQRSTSRSAGPSEPSLVGDDDGMDFLVGTVPLSVSSLDLDGLLVDGAASLTVWTTDVDGNMTPAEWTPVMREQRATIERLCAMVDELNAAVPKVVDKLNARYRRVIATQKKDGSNFKATTEEMKEQLGSLLQLVIDHGSLSDAVNAALKGSDTSLASLASLANLEQSLETFTDELVDFSTQLEMSRSTLLSLINRVSATSSKCTQALDQRVTTLESAGVSGAGFTLPQRAAGATQGSGLDGDTSFGKAQVGNVEVDLSMNSMLKMLREIDSRVQVLSDHSRSTGVVFHRLAFASEADFGYWYMANNPRGEGPAAFVDIVSIWAFASSESGATEWLVDLHGSQSVGFKASPDTLYAHSMTTRYPRAFVGKVDTILSAQTIKMLESVDTWRGNGMGDGFKERLLDQLQHAVRSHANYCEDYLPDGPLRQAALRSAQVTQHFFQTLASYLDDELTMLTSFNLPAKQTLLLLSNQVVHICDDLFEYRNQAKGVDVSN